MLMLRGEGLTSLPSACVAFAPYRRALRVTLMHFHELIANQLVNGEQTGDPHNPREKGKRVTEIDCAPLPICEMEQ